MIGAVLSIALLLVLFGGCIVAFRVVRQKPLKPFTRNLVLVLLVIELILAGLHTLTWAEIPAFWQWFLDLDHELNPGTVFSAAQLLMVGLVAAMIGLRGRSLPGWQRLYWGLLAATFFFLSIDEYDIIHEEFGPAWRLLYGTAGGILLVIVAVAYRFGFRQEKRLFLLLCIGLVIMAISGVVLEKTIHDWRTAYDVYDYDTRVAAYGSLNRLKTLEEVFEMIGATIVLAGFLSYGQERLAADGWRLTKRVVAGGGALWSLFLLTSLFLPSLEARFLAHPAGADYLDGDMALLGYRASEEILHPGDLVTITLYWQSRDFVLGDYGVSVHLLTYPDARSVAQADILMYTPFPTPQKHPPFWLPGIAGRKQVELTLPQDLPTPGRYQLIIRLWETTDGFPGVPVSQTALPLLTADALIVGHLPALSDAPVPPPPSEASYRVGDSFTLAGYALPATAPVGGTLPLQFWWQTGTGTGLELTQFVHLLSDTGEFRAGHDQPPFGGRFPTTDWPPGITIRDEWRVPLPEDLPAGAYQVYTGLYVPATVERVPVTDGDGQPVADNAIYLGTVTLEGP